MPPLLVLIVGTGQFLHSFTACKFGSREKGVSGAALHKGGESPEERGEKNLRKGNWKAEVTSVLLGCQLVSDGWP